MIKGIFHVACAAAILAACQPTVPSDTAPFESPVPVEGSTLPENRASAPLPDSVTAAVIGTPQAPAAGVVLNDAGISAEQDFDAVSAQRSIESDAALIERNRAQYTVIEPTDVPVRPNSSQPNIVEYALRTTNPVGVPLYPRSGLRSAQRAASACAAFASPDLAQIEFLSRGGPQRDRRGLDPDGDGFACSWNPTPFRAARASVAQPAADTAAVTGAAPAAAPQPQQPQQSAVEPSFPTPLSPAVEPLVISTE